MINPVSLGNQDRLGRSFARDVAAVVVLTLVLVLFYWGFLSGRYFIWDDTLKEFYPGVNYFAKSIQAGRFPLWFPGVRDGMAISLISVAMMASLALGRRPTSSTSD
jgi:hypothetical protein